MSDIASGTQIALRRLAKSVAVITAQWDGKRYAMAATAVEGLSLEPPSLLLCVNKTASLAAPLAAGVPFAVNLLSREHSEIAGRCCAPWSGEQRFELGTWSSDDSGPPLLREAQASFVCVPDIVTSYGTHHIVIGKIIAVELNGDVDPLVYADGAYHGIAAAA
jgi:flavin reductase (DIM6/NTAB) family NADH-FMN oxidoreductase RutF